MNVHPKSLGFRSTSDLDPQRSIFSRFRRAAALFPCPALCVGPLSRATDSTRSIKTDWVDKIVWEDLARTWLWVRCYHAEDSIDESDAKNGLRGLNSDWFWARCVRKAPLCGHRALQLLRTPKNESFRPIWRLRDIYMLSWGMKQFSAISDSFTVGCVKLCRMSSV